MFSGGVEKVHWHELEYIVLIVSFDNWYNQCKIYFNGFVEKIQYSTNTSFEEFKVFHIRLNVTYGEQIPLIWKGGA